MQVLITGGTGMLGTTLAPFLRACGHDVIVHGRSNRCDIQCDMTNRQATLKLVAKAKPQCIVNLIAMTSVDQCERAPHDAYLLNVKTVENLVASLREQPDVRLIHISTDHVYDSAGLDSEDNIRLNNTYALTKYAGEIAAITASATILRTNFFGPSRLIGRISFSDWLLRCLQEKKSFTGFSDVIINPLTMNTLSAMIDIVMRRPAAGIFNLGSSTALSKASFAIEIANFFELSTENMTCGSVDAQAMYAYRPKDMSMNCSKFEYTFGTKLPTLQYEIQTLKRNFS
jgi:dTDP-4-dehydrorhamnose reductase